MLISVPCKTSTGAAGTLDETSNNIAWFEEHWDSKGTTIYRNKTDDVL